MFLKYLQEMKSDHASRQDLLLPIRIFQEDHVSYAYYRYMKIGTPAKSFMI